MADKEQKNQSSTGLSSQAADMPGKHKFSSSRLKLLIIVLVLIIGLGAWWLWARSNNNSTTQPYLYTYDKNQLMGYKLASSNGASISFDKLQKQSKFTGSTYGSEFDKLSTADFAHILISHKDPAFNHVAVSSLSVGVGSFDKPPTADYLNNIKTALASAETNNKYQAQTKTLKNFVATGADKRYSLTLGHAQPFTNPNIKDNAWQFDISLVDQAALAAKQYTKTPVHKGKFIYAVGQKGYYYYSLISLDYDWHNNQALWQQMLNSIKIEE